MASYLTLILAIGTAFSFGASVVLVKRALRGSTPIAASILTIGVNVVVLGGLLALFPQQAPAGLDALVFFVVAGLLAPGLARTMNFLSVERIGASAGLTLSNASPLFVLPIAPFILGEQLTPYIVGGASLIVIGILVLGAETEGINLLSVRRLRQAASSGFAFGIVAAILYGLSYVARKLGINSSNAPILGAMVTTGTSLLLLSLMVAASKGLRSRLRVSQSSLGALISAGVVSSVAWVLQFFALSLGDAVVVVPLMDTAPLFGVVLSYSFLRDVERVTTRVILAALAVVGGAFLLSI